MGAACEKCMTMFSKPPPAPSPHKQPEPEQPESSRYISKNMANKEEKISESQWCRSSNIEMESNSSVREGKSFMKIKSTALFSEGQDRKHSTITQMTFDAESIIIKGTDSTASSKDYYTLIDKLAFIKKTKDEIRITSPDGHSVVNCTPPLIFCTLSVAEGRPIEVIEEIPTNKYIQTDDSPIRVRLKLQCRTCKKQLKATFCKGLIEIGSIKCPKCEKGEGWRMLDIESNAPVWGEGAKIEDHEEMEEVPGVLKVMGCVNCMKFSDCQRMRCGCMLCHSCEASIEELSFDEQCRMCEGSYIT